MAPVIREATVEDLPAMLAMKVRAWRWAYRGLLPEDHLAALSAEDQEEGWRDWFETRTVGEEAWLAEDDGAVIGFVSFGRSRDADTDDGTAEVGAIYVEPPRVGTGLGRTLFSLARERLRAAGFRRATLWVLAANDLARDFYEKAGWAWDGTTLDHRVDCANFPTMRYAVDLSDAIAPDRSRSRLRRARSGSRSSSPRTRRSRST